MKLFGMCIDKRVVIGVVAAAGLLWWLAPNAFAAALPFLIFAICPLSMLVMMKAMNMNQPDSNQAGGRPNVSASPSNPPADAAADLAAVSAAAADVDARRN